MKRLIFAVVIFLITLSIVLFGTHYVKQANDVMSSYLCAIETAAKEDDITKATELCVKAEKEWVSFEERLTLFVNHAEISEIGVSLSAIKPLIEHNEKAEFFSALNEVKVMIKHFASMESIK